MTDFGVKLTKYIPHTPTPKQKAFLLLPQREAFFGGAAGGGKSDALLMAGLQHVDIPGYSAIIFRKTLSDLKLPGALLDRAKDWLAPFLRDGLINYVASNHTYEFPTKLPDGTAGPMAKLVFGYIGDANTYARYQSAEFQCVCFDESTHFSEYDYTYMHSRIRKNVCPLHSKRDGEGNPIYQETCGVCQQQKALPLRMRAASNPGGRGHRWVKERFSIERDPKTDRYIGFNSNRPFVPSYLQDNPYIDQASYMEGLDEMSDEVTRKQLKSGDWGASSGARFQEESARFYSVQGGLYYLGRKYIANPQKFLKLFQTLDPAASTKEGPGDEFIYQNTDRDYSYSVISTWGLTDRYDLIWLDMWRARVEVPELLKAVASQYRLWRPEYLTCESNGPGSSIYQMLVRKGFTVKGIFKSTDKIKNATEAMIRMEQGKIWLPEEAAWKKTAMDEVFFWIGHPHERDDIIDTLADAAREVHWAAMDEVSDDYEPFEPSGDFAHSDVPSVIGTSMDFAPNTPPAWYQGAME